MNPTKNKPFLTLAAAALFVSATLGVASQTGAIDRIREITPVANGDASIRLTTGTDLRLSRGFREKLRAVLKS